MSSVNSMVAWRAVAHLPLLKLLFASLTYAFPLTINNNVFDATKKSASAEEGDTSQWLYLTVAALLVLTGGAFAGLTIALMGQDEIYLQVLAASGEGPERKNAQKVLNLLKKGKHWVLVTLLLGNVITNESLPIMLDRSLGGGWQAVLGSTVLIVIFGEILPQSVCVRFGLPIGASMTPFVLLVMWVLAPIAYPTAKLLDFLLGQDHGTIYKKAGLKTLVTLHRTLGTSPNDRLSKDEVTIISAVLDLKEKPVGSIMTPMEDVFTLSAETVLDAEMMDTILSEGYSRIPIYSPEDPANFIGMLLVKMLITYDPADELLVDDFQLATLPETRPETSCLDIVNFFQEGKSHMVLVSEFPGDARGALGVCTLEDVIEELIGEEIIDESDVFVDVHKAIRRIQPVSYYKIPKPAQPDDEVSEYEGSPVERSRTSMGGRKLSSVSDRSGKGVAPNSIRRSLGGSEPLRLTKTSPDVRAHLSHLGPSNSAARPKATRINTVKIKPVHPSAAKASQHKENPKSPVVTPHSKPVEASTIDTIALSPSERAREIEEAAIETTGLLGPGKSSSDGVQAVGYGTLSTSPPNKMKPPIEQSRYSINNPSPLRQSSLLDDSIDPLQKIPEAVTEESNGPTPSADKGKTSSQSPESKSPKFSTGPLKLIVTPDDDDDDEEGSEEEEVENPDENESGNTIKSGGTVHSTSRLSIVRSGSIFERETESNGVRKVVLDVQEANDGEDNTIEPSESQALLGFSPAEPSNKDKKKKKKPKKKKKKGNGNA